MADTIGYEGLTAMLRAAAAAIRDNHALLSQLDSNGGDGDHGTTMVRAMGCLDKAVGESKPPSLQDLLQGVGWAIMGVDGGATGPLFGALFTGMSEAAGGRETLDAPGLAAAFESGLAAIRKYSRANVGDKTMLDALVPAVEALRKAADAGAGVCEALAQAAAEAEAGAERTTALQARFGRAKNIGERSIGSRDAGATSVALMFKGFSEGVTIHA
jgi:dihydroxyacetone kinase-like protein